MAASPTVTFNVGGKQYEVSKSLLEGYPDTLLAQKASVAETESSSSPIFLDRDPDRFAYCLDYMRDNGRVYLPESVSKSAVLEDLAFLGFTEIDESLLDDESSRRRSASRLMNQLIHSANEEVSSMEKEGHAIEKKVKTAKVVMYCFRECSEVTSQEVEVTFKPKDFGIQWVRVLGMLRPDLDDSYLKSFCEKLGLQHVSLTFDVNGGFDVRQATLKFKKLL